jgi:hypothetical protein
LLHILTKAEKFHNDHLQTGEAGKEEPRSALEIYLYKSAFKN